MGQRIGGALKIGARSALIARQHEQRDDRNGEDAYLYNGQGQRVRQMNGTTVNPASLLVCDEAGHIIGEYNSSTGKASKEFVYLCDTPVGVLKHVVTGIVIRLSNEI